MTEETTGLPHKYLRHEKRFPHIWCPGCGNGIVLGSLIRAIERSGLKQDDVVLVSGIGCSGRMTVYADFNTLHTTHGRALTFATGIKLAKPSLNVIVIMGDGDATAIGGNHFIHAARRNMDLTALIINNQIYGMTGGQQSPTSPYGSMTTTSPYGHIENAFSISELAMVAGASLVGRGTVFHVQLLDTLIEKALLKKGFSVIEVLSNCHVYFGRKNNMESPVKMMKWFQEHAVTIEKARQMKDEERENKVSIGVLMDSDKPSFLEKHQTVREQAKASLKK
jgi:2-oxoglutarate ferredoxin oxidoreductase subunit beta